MLFIFPHLACLSAITALHVRKALKKQTSAIYHFNATVNAEGSNLCYVEYIYVICNMPTYAFLYSSGEICLWKYASAKFR